MTRPLSRRDFLRLAGFLFLGSLTPGLSRLVQSAFQQADRSNIILIIFDALSARHLSLYGYSRQTCPNLERFAQRATVYHQHHAAANFTTPSTASLFTGTYPFTHRVFALNSMVPVRIRPHNLLALFKPAYTEAAMVQNIYADLLLYQFSEKLKEHLGPTEYALIGNTFYDHIFINDPVYAANSYDLFLFKPIENPGSIFTALPVNFYRQTRKKMADEARIQVYPEGLPFLYDIDVNFTFEQVIDGAYEMLGSIKTPFFSYFHFMPPHYPYRPRNEFTGMFKDGWEPQQKEIHPLSQKYSQEFLNELRLQYDRFIAHVDAEFGRLIDQLDASGMLENSYVIFTSDHGELFERGEAFHTTPLLYEGVVHIPLLIHAPGQTVRQDIRTLTSNVDLFPTLAALSGLPQPETLEGQALPGLGLPEPSTDRAAWIVEAQLNPARAPLTKASLALLRWPYKLTSYFGYQAKYNVEDSYEFYDLENDPEEVDNLFDSHPLAPEFRAEMHNKLSEVNSRYLSSDAR